LYRGFFHSSVYNIPYRECIPFSQRSLILVSSVIFYAIRKLFGKYLLIWHTTLFSYTPIWNLFQIRTSFVLSLLFFSDFMIIVHTGDTPFPYGMYLYTGDFLLCTLLS